MGSVSDRLIQGEGTPEDAWQAWGLLASCPLVDAAVLVPPGSRAVFVAPHPDDEVLAAGGLLSMMSAFGREILIVAVTDGDASHPNLGPDAARGLAELRRRESREGWRRLGLTRHVEQRLGVSDGRVSLQIDALRDHLCAQFQPSDVVFTTWRLDGHPDHEAVGRAAAEACARRGARLIEMPVWTWHWARPGDARVPWHRLRSVLLSAELRVRKRSAIHAHRTQLQTSADGRAPVLPMWALARLIRSREFFFAPVPSAAGAAPEPGDHAS